jgi:hypothetical protein
VRMQIEEGTGKKGACEEGAKEEVAPFGMSV